MGFDKKWSQYFFNSRNNSEDLNDYLEEHIQIQTD